MRRSVSIFGKPRAELTPSDVRIREGFRRTDRLLRHRRASGVGESGARAIACRFHPSCNVVTFRIPY